jgi:hypothetical protein
MTCLHGEMQSKYNLLLEYLTKTVSDIDKIYYV